MNLLYRASETGTWPQSSCGRAGEFVPGRRVLCAGREEDWPEQVQGGLQRHPGAVHWKLKPRLILNAHVLYRV